MEDALKVNSGIIKNLKRKIMTGEWVNIDEEETRQWFVTPFLSALGWDPFTSDIKTRFIEHEDINGKILPNSAYNVEYALQIDDEPVAVVKTLRFREHITPQKIIGIKDIFDQFKHVDVAIATNGDAFWFYTEGERDIDKEPNLKISLSTLQKDDLEKLEKFTKERLGEKLTALKIFENACRELAMTIKAGHTPDWILYHLEDEAQADMSVIDDDTLNIVLTKILLEVLGKSLSDSDTNTEIKDRYNERG